jgi:hypothetical protein
VDEVMKKCKEVLAEAGFVGRFLGSFVVVLEMVSQVVFDA